MTIQRIHKTFSGLLAAALMFSAADVSAQEIGSEAWDKVDPALLAAIDSDRQRVAREGSEPEAYRIVVELKPVETAEQLKRAFASKASNRALLQNVRQVQDRVFAATQSAAEHLSVWYRYQSTYGFSAFADAEGVAALTRLEDVAYVHEMPTYTQQDSQAHPLTNVDDAHSSGFTGGSFTGLGVTIAIIDSGIDHNHPAFGGETDWPNSKILGGYDYADNDSDPRVDCSTEHHGTSVTGVAVGNGGGVTGSAKDAKTVHLKVKSAAKCGQNEMDGDITAAIDWAVTNRNQFNPPIKIISMSLSRLDQGNVFTSECRNITEKNALIAARSAGMVVLAASGNVASSAGIGAPACHPDVVAVGATYDSNVGSSRAACDSNSFADKIACYSNSSNSSNLLDLLAPAHCATTANNGGGTNTCFAGTSSATPYAAGVAALLFNKNLNLTRSDAINALYGGGVMLTDSRNGAIIPRVDAAASLALVSTTSFNYKLFALDNSSSNEGEGTKIFEVNRATGAITQNNSLTGSPKCGSNMAFHPGTGKLYAVSCDKHGAGKKLYEINPATGATSNSKTLYGD